jgi:hypothetical protein
VGALPQTRRRSIHASRNLSRAPSASLRDRLAGQRSACISLRIRCFVPTRKPSLSTRLLTLSDNAAPGLDLGVYRVDDGPWTSQAPKEVRACQPTCR